MVNFLNDTDELQDDIFDHFELHPEITLQWIRADKIDTWFETHLKLGNIDCETINSSSHADDSGGYQSSPAPPEPAEPPPPPEPPLPPKTCVSNCTVVASSLSVARVGPIRAASTGQPVRELVPGRYATGLTARWRNGGRWNRLRRALPVRFDVRCRINSNVGCLG